MNNEGYIITIEDAETSEYQTMCIHPDAILDKETFALCAETLRQQFLQHSKTDDQ
jgi:hypothetical protein